MINGHQQSLEMTHTVQKSGSTSLHDQPNGIPPSFVPATSEGFRVQGGHLADQAQWAQEVRRSDERCE